MSMCDYCLRFQCAAPMWHINAVKKGDLYCDSALIKKMPIISFGHTTPPFVAREKDITRRNWTERHAGNFHEGKVCKAYSKGPQYGGECIGILKLTATPFKQSTLKIGSDDYDKEGFHYLDIKHRDIEGTLPLINACIRWKDSDKMLYVVPFEIVEVFPGMKEKYSTDEEIIKAVKALKKAIG